MTEILMNVVASEKLVEVETLVSKLAAAEGLLEAGYAKLAFLLRDVSEQRYWDGSYKSFGEFLNHLSDKFKLGKSQLYNYLSTARDLGGDVTEEQLNIMGISKALALREAKNTTGTIPENVLTAALDPTVTVKDIKRLLFESNHLPELEQGTWFDAEMEFYVTAEERAEILQAFDIAMKVDPPISEKQKTYGQKKEIMLRLCREFIGTWEQEVYGKSSKAV